MRYLRSALELEKLIALAAEAYWTRNVEIVKAAYATGTQPVLAWRQFAALQHHCTLCIVFVYKPLCMQ
jgi:hypothetical protein